MLACVVRSFSQVVLGLPLVRQENEREDQGEGVQNSGKTSTGVRSRDMGIEEGAGKEIGDNKSGDNHKESTGKEVEVVWACDEKRGTLRRREGDGNESTGEKEERNA